MEDLHQVAALVGTATWVARTLPQAGEETGSKVGAVVRGAVGHAVSGEVGDGVKAAVKVGGVSCRHGAHGGAVGQALARPRIGSHPRLGFGPLTLKTRGVHDKVADHRKARQGLEEQGAALAHEAVEASHVSQHDTPVGTERCGGCSVSIATPEGKASIEVALNGLEEVLQGGVTGQGAGHGIES